MMAADAIKEDIVFEYKHITKQYPGVLALNNLSLAFRRGEVHALLGENGAGKSTLIKAATGAMEPSGGTMVVNGKEFQSFDPVTSRENGIVAVYQEFNLVNDLSVAENVFLGNPIKKHGMIDFRRMYEESQKIFDDFGIPVDSHQRVRELTTGFQQMVEIAKALRVEAKLLILDEPTASLSTNEVDTLFDIVGKLKASGVTVVFISHRMDEIFAIADRVTVMRDGEWIDTLNICDTNREDLIRLMVGRELNETIPKMKPMDRDEIILEVEHLSGNGVKDVSFQLRQGEILGFGGLIGAGRTETAQIICGIARKQGGRIRYRGRECNFKEPLDAIQAGIALVPEDRKKQGILAHMSVEENISFPSYQENSKAGILNARLNHEITEKYIQMMSIKTPNSSQLLGNLSGGNQQKVVIAKWLAKSPDVILMDEPTRGIDVEAKQEIYYIMHDLIRQGKTIIMISSDMEELLGMSTRIVVFCEGRVTGELDRAEFTQENVLTLASPVAGRDKE